MLLWYTLPPLEEKKMRLLTVHLPETYINAIDTLVQQDVFPNRSEAIRVAVRDLLKAELGGFVKIEVKEPAANLLE